MGTRCADHVTPLYPQKLALTSPTGGGRSVGIVRSRTKATEFSLVLVFEVPEMFLEPNSELAAGLSDVLHTACGASQLVYSTVIIFTSSVLVPCCQKFSYGVVCAEGNFDVSVFEYLREDSCFSAYVCEFFNQ